jgi:hypothetical protein
MEAKAINDLIRTKLQAGCLPRDSTPRAFERPGNWQKCSTCDETMAKALLMMDVYPLTNGKVIRFHGDCYTLWNEERNARRSPVSRFFDAARACSAMMEPLTSASIALITDAARPIASCSMVVLSCRVRAVTASTAKSRSGSNEPAESRNSSGLKLQVCSYPLDRTSGPNWQSRLPRSTSTAESPTNKLAPVETTLSCCESFFS